MRRTTVVAGGIVSIMGMASRSAHADWPMARHDPQRTGLAVGTSNITIPVVTWRYFLGGSVSPERLVTADLDDDGIVEIVHATDGSVRAYDLDGGALWATDNIGFDQLYRPDDLNGDGRVEIIARTPGQVHAVDAGSGTILWSTPADALGTITVVRTGDLDGDGVHDLLVAECGCCAGRTGQFGFAYSFAGGFGSPTTLWQIPIYACGSDRTVTLLNATGDASRELLLSTAQTVRLYSGAGTLLAETADLGTWTAISQCRPADLDDDGQDEALCITNTNLAPDIRRVFVLHHDGTSAVALLWSATVAPADGDVFFTDPLSDLDDDGSLEVVIAVKDGSGAWTTLVLDPLTGTTLATAPGKLQGVAPLLEGSRLVFTGEERTDAWALPGERDGGEMTLTWSVEGRVTVQERDLELQHRAYLGLRTVAPDLDADGRPELVLVSTDPPIGLVAVPLEDPYQPPLVELSAPETDVATAWQLAPSAEHSGGLLVSQSDGRLLVIPSGAAGEPSALLSAGNYYAPGGFRDLSRPPVVASLAPDEAQRVLVPDGRGALVNLGAATATLAHPPARAWSRPRTRAAAVVTPNDSLPFIAAVHQATPSYASVVAIAADGSARWFVPAPEAPLLDLVPGDLNGDPTPDLALHWGPPSDVTLAVRALDGRDGTTLWDSALVSPGAGRQPAGLSVGRFDTDAIDDVYFQGPRATVLSGVDGSTLADADPSSPYGMFTLYDLDGQPGAEVTFHASSTRSTFYSSDLATALWSGPEELAYPYGAIAPCPSSPRFAQGSLGSPAQLRITDMTGDGLGQSTVVYLASGEVFPSIDTMGTTRHGQVTSVSVHSDLTGTGHPSAVVGSTDGWLYAVNACTGDLDFSLHLGAPVGAPVFGDTDGDGFDEIVTTVASGELVAIRQEVVPAPDFVWDIVPAQGITDRDTDETFQRTLLSARWAEVPGALAYQVAIVDANGTDLVAPPWADVGDVLEHTVTGLTLNIGARYRFVVRARIAEGLSVDAISDGIRVVPPEPGTGGAGGGAGAAAGGVGTGATAGAAGTPNGSGGADAGGADVGGHGANAGARHLSGAAGAAGAVGRAGSAGAAGIGDAAGHAGAPTVAGAAGRAGNGAAPPVAGGAGRAGNGGTPGVAGSAGLGMATAGGAAGQPEPAAGSGGIPLGGTPGWAGLYRPGGSDDLLSGRACTCAAPRRASGAGAVTCLLLALALAARRRTSRQPPPHLLLAR
ncbi:MAG: VCBS repeat-containing protein [Polyangiaceae bacterium]|nr:VCBS repeat-containing protein [Polyangiaceae bacterium]